MRSVRGRQAGFTLAEMTVVAVILAILAAVAMPLAKIAVQREKETELRRALREIRSAIDAYKKLADEKKIDVEEGTDGFPLTLDVLVKGVKIKESASGTKSGDKNGEKITKLLRRVPRDPTTGTAEWGLLSSQDAPDSSTWDRKNVYDVYSKSRGTAIDGTKYKDW
jgi:general secretion pathway protein G